MSKKTNKFRKQLERIGMTKEFEDWMKTPTSKRAVKKGDRVQVTQVRQGDEDYYRVGDKGTVSYLDSAEDIGGFKLLQVTFDPDSFHPNTWYVRPGHLKII